MSLCDNKHVPGSPPGQNPVAAVLAAAVILAACAMTAVAEPAWTRTGDCTACHTATLPNNLMWITNSDSQADPDGSGPLPSLKTFQVSRGQTGKSLTVQLANLNPGDGYAVAMVGLSRPGVLNAAQLAYSPDCAWADWKSGLDHFYSNPVRYNKWGTGPTVLTYSIGIDAAAAYDFYDVLFAIVGVKADTGERFYQEEHFYVSVPPPNWNPTVTMTSPANGATFTTPTDIELAANAGDPDGSIAKVEFFAGTTLLGQDTTAPYTMTWMNVPVGTYAINARATDNLGATSLSQTVNIVVSLPPPVPGDFDHDGDVDQSDYAHLQLCLAGTGMAVSSDCLDASLDGNTSVDNSDVALFALCLSGANVPGDVHCLD